MDTVKYVVTFEAENKGSYAYRYDSLSEAQKAAETAAPHYKAVRIESHTIRLLGAYKKEVMFVPANSKD